MQVLININRLKLSYGISPSLSCVVLCIDDVDGFEMNCQIHRKSEDDDDSLCGTCMMVVS